MIVNYKDNCGNTVSDSIYQKKVFPKDPELKKPPWLKIRMVLNSNLAETKSLTTGKNLFTVCEEASCPNIHECWSQKHATFMILGDICTRSCSFCSVKTGRPGPVDPQEPIRVAESVVSMGLKHVVITSVDRDDLQDGGASHFASCIKAIRQSSNATIEILTPDFRNKSGALDKIIEAEPNVFNHNLETVPSLYPSIRPGSRYFHSLNILYKAKEKNPNIFTKSGFMVGLGETNAEIYQLMDDMQAANIDFITIGQYLRPTKNHHPVMRYVHPDEFDFYKQLAIAKGFTMVASGPLVRSSYHADEDFKNLQEKKHRQLQCN